MKKVKSLILIVLFSLLLLQSQHVEASISKGKQYQYLWKTKFNFTINGESFLTVKESYYAYEILYVEDGKVGVKRVTANGVSFFAYTLVTKDQWSALYPDINYQPYFLDKDYLELFYEHWMDDCSDKPYMLDCSAEDRVFFYIEMNSFYNNSIGYNETIPDERTSFYDLGELTKTIQCEYTKDGVLSYLKIEKDFSGSISDDYYLDELTLTDVKRSSNISIYLVALSFIIISTLYMQLRRRNRI